MIFPTRRARQAAGRRPAVAGAAAFSKKAYVVFSYIHRDSLCSFFIHSQGKFDVDMQGKFVSDKTWHIEEC